MLASLAILVLALAGDDVIRDGDPDLKEAKAAVKSVRESIARGETDELAALSALEGKLDAAATPREKAIAHACIGLLHATQQNVDEAVASLRAALDIAPRFPGALWGLACACVDAGEKDQAKLHLRKALEVEPNYRPALTRLASLLVEDNTIESLLEAHALLMESTKSRTDLKEIRALFHLGFMLRERAEFKRDETRAHYVLLALRLQEKYPDNHEAQSLGVASGYLAGEWRPETLRDLHGMINEHPTSDKFVGAVAKLFWDWEAEEWFREFTMGWLRLQPTSGRVSKTLDALEQALGYSVARVIQDWFARPCLETLRNKEAPVEEVRTALRIGLSLRLEDEGQQLPEEYRKANAWYRAKLTTAITRRLMDKDEEVLLLSLQYVREQCRRTTLVSLLAHFVRVDEDRGITARVSLAAIRAMNVCGKIGAVPSLLYALGDSAAEVGTEADRVLRELVPDVGEREWSDYVVSPEGSARLREAIAVLHQNISGPKSPPRWHNPLALHCVETLLAVEGLDATLWDATYSFVAKKIGEDLRDEALRGNPTTPEERESLLAKLREKLIR